MTKYEFDHIKIHTVITDRFNSQDMFEIYDLDVFGGDSRVLAGRQLNVDNTRYMRIDAGNCQFWNIVGKMV